MLKWMQESGAKKCIWKGVHATVCVKKSAEVCKKYVSYVWVNELCSITNSKLYNKKLYPNWQSPQPYMSGYKPRIKSLHSRAAPSVEVHHLVNSPDTASDSRVRQIKNGVGVKSGVWSSTILCHYCKKMWNLKVAKSINRWLHHMCSWD